MTLVSFESHDGVARITLDDGKANVLSPAMLAEVNAALDRAQAEGAVVLLSGREGVFSGGFDLGVLQQADETSRTMLNEGFLLAERLLSFPRPVVAACTGHAVAMGAFLLLSCDHRIGAAGAFRLVVNEVAIGLTLPRSPVEICRQRLTPAAFNRAVTLAEVFSPEDGVAAGFLDAVVPAADLAAAAQDVATRLTTLDADAHAATKLRARAGTLAALRTAIQQDDAEMAALLGSPA